MSQHSPSRTYQEYQKMAKAYPPLSKFEQEVLASEAALGDPNAKERLFKHNAKRLLYFADLYATDNPQPTDRLPLGGSPRKKYMQRWKKYAPTTLTTDEVLSAAAIGLWKAIETFDPSRGVFNQHANVLIWQSIQDLRVREEKQQERIDKAIRLYDPAEAKFVRPQNPNWHPPTHRRTPPGFETSEDINSSPQATPKFGMPDGGDSSTEHEISQVVFDKYVDQLLTPEDAERLRRLLAGETQPDDDEFPSWVGKTLRAGIPEKDWHWLAETLR